MEELSGISEKRDEMGSPNRMVSPLEPRGPEGGMPPRVFCNKSVEVVETKGRESEKKRQERKRVRNSMKRRGLGLEWRAGWEGLVRENTGNHTTDRGVCQ